MGRGIRAPFVPQQARTSATHLQLSSRTMLGSLISGGRGAAQEVV